MDNTAKNDDVIVVDNGETYENTENTMAAKKYAEQAKLEADRAEISANDAEYNSDLAKDWAIKLGNKVIENGIEVDFSSKYYAQSSANFAADASKLAEESKEIFSKLRGSYVMGCIYDFDAPVDNPLLKPLNSGSTGVVLTDAKNTYQAFWAYITGNKAKAKAGDNRYSRYNYTEAQYNAEIAAKGFCGCYVIDEVNNTVRLPYFGLAYKQGYKSGDVNKQAGLPDFSGTAGPTITGIANPGAAIVNATRTGGFKSSAKDNSYKVSDYPHGNPSSFSRLWYSLGSLIFKGSDSNAIFGRSSTVQTDAVGIYYYLCVGDTLKEPDLIDFTSQLRSYTDALLLELERAYNLAIENITNSAAGQIATVNAVGSLQVDAVNEAGRGQINTINSVAEIQVATVNAEGEAQVNAVRAEGTDQIANVRAEASGIIYQATEQAQLAEQSAENASLFANNAAQSAVEAAVHAERAEKAESNAVISATSAGESAIEAANNATGAEASAVLSEQSATNAANSATASAASATSAGESAIGAQNSRISAEQSANSAASSATAAATSATQAQTQANRAEAAANSVDAQCLLSINNLSNVVVKAPEDYISVVNFGFEPTSTTLLADTKVAIPNGLDGAGNAVSYLYTTPLIDKNDENLPSGDLYIIVHTSGSNKDTLAYLLVSQLYVGVAQPSLSTYPVGTYWFDTQKNIISKRVGNYVFEREDFAIVAFQIGGTLKKVYPLRVLTEIDGEFLLDSDVARISATGASALVYNSYPGLTSINLGVGATNTDYTATRNGLVTLQGVSTAAGQYVIIYANGQLRYPDVATGASQTINASGYFRKGSQYQIRYSTPIAQMSHHIFTPAGG